MTANQLRYQELLEKNRSNLANEALGRSELFETTRSNKAREAETSRSNLAREYETNRANVAREAETNRSNLANEKLADSKYTQDNWRYWLDVFGFGPSARSDFAKVFKIK